MGTQVNLIQLKGDGKRGWVFHDLSSTFVFPPNVWGVGYGESFWGQVVRIFDSITDLHVRF